MAEHLKINTDEKMRIILEIILRQLPMTQAIYHFGSSAVGEESGTGRLPFRAGKCSAVPGRSD